MSLKHAVAQFETEQDAFKHLIDDLALIVKKSKFKISDLVSDKNEFQKG